MRHIKFILVSVLCLGFLTTALPAQDSGIPVAVLVYMHAQDGSDYVNLERDIWMPVHSQRIREGKLLNWQLYEVVRSSDNDNSYNYLIV